MTESWVVVGLGNPGREYQRTRHNVGYLVVEELAGRLGLQFARHRRAHADAAEGHAFVGTPQHCRVVLVKARTYMNESGGPVKAVLDFTKTDNLVVIHDELDIPLGALRVKHGGGDNGHNGLRSLRKSLGHGDFYRVRCGVGRPMGRQDPADYLLSDFRAAERSEVALMVAEAADATEFLLANGLDATQSRFNR
ncbi:MAG: aminoacyl-tRNA hydrolase [Actinobacteria bacterium]|uniref:aminoacyl-tRNA hydrolase n=1 Tax=Gordonia sp. (in: high G+C Gram-positive bacteria) TaxID=84139 RepID=UPI002B79A9FF|nr:aminoacyl-tRNA hydrolase [Micrococcales bacterium]MCB9429045.1 aminoacyl-tRNA hydrolase [Actinomycetota bacterium]MCO5298611.1 aminoacyl-tRNA hydrolase [Candidatus Nanopelagicales bacterium]HPE11564.1 aminoacyl-tRNA hydrolase [Actinomycetota bacterium]HPJ19015.1 aminoacyl-tRNA hydrolase [Actinomycetota bacterium]